MIKINNLSKVYKLGSCTVNALDNVSTEIASGEFVAIVGASGSGKTTLMNIIGCLDTATYGDYFLNGVDIKTLSPRELSEIRCGTVGFVFQGFNLVPTLTALENVELPLIYKGIKKSEREERSMRALAEVGLSERALHKPSQLSGGQQQRVAIARAFAAETPLILADEPCGNLDSRSGEAVMDMLRSLNKSGKTVVLITHDEKAADSAMRKIRISDGRIVSSV